MTIQEASYTMSEGSKAIFARWWADKPEKPYIDSLNDRLVIMQRELIIHHFNSMDMKAKIRAGLTLARLEEEIAKNTEIRMLKEEARIEAERFRRVRSKAKVKTEAEVSEPIVTPIVAEPTVTPIVAKTAVTTKPNIRTKPVNTGLVTTIKPRTKAASVEEVVATTNPRPRSRTKPVETSTTRARARAKKPIEV